MLLFSSFLKCHVEALNVDYASRFKVYTESRGSHLLGLCKFILCDLLCVQQQTESLRAERRLYMETMASDAHTEVETHSHAQKQTPAFLFFFKTVYRTDRFFHSMLIT